MLTEALTQTLDIRKAAAREVTVSGEVELAKLPRLSPLLAADSGVVRAELSCSRDEENRYLVAISASAELSVICQRCLEPMTVQVTSDNTLAVVWDDEQARHLPRHLDPLIATEEATDLWQLVEDELFLALPEFNYHDTQACKETLAGFNRREQPDTAGAEEKPNPFNVLAQLKPGSNN
jgi:uncharacterized protein